MIAIEFSIIEILLSIIIFILLSICITAYIIGKKVWNIINNIFPPGVLRSTPAPGGEK